MAINCSRRDLDQLSFVECPDGSGLPARKTKICNVDELANAINKEDDGVSDCDIINISMLANTSISHTFPDGTNRFRIKIMECGELQLSKDDFVSGDIYTIDVGCEWAEDRVKLISKTIYLKTNINASLQIMQWI